MSKQFDEAFTAYAERRAKPANKGMIGSAPWYVRALVQGAIMGALAAWIVVLFFVWGGVVSMWGS